MLSIVVTQYVSSGRDLVAALRTHSKTITEKTQELLAPLCKGEETVPDAGFLLELWARRLERQIDALVAADEAHNEELSDDADPRRRRDDAVEALRTVILSVKQGIATLFGSETLVTFKVPNEIARDPSTIERVARDVASSLESKTLPKPTFDGVKEVDPGPWKAKLKTQLKNLETASKDVAREVREAQVTLVAKNRAMDAFEDAFGDGASMGWGMLASVGEKEHAERIRLTPRKLRASKGGQEREGEGGGSEGTNEKDQ